MPAIPYTGDMGAVIPVQQAPKAVPYTGDMGAVVPATAPQENSLWSEKVKPALMSAAEGAGAGILGLAGVLGMKHYFPGARVLNSSKGALRNWMRDLDQTIKIRDKDSGIKDLFGQYMKSVSDSGRPDQTFMDWAAGHSDPNVADFIAKTVRSSGKEAQFDTAQKAKAFDANGRILAALSKATGVPDNTLPQTLAELQAAKKANAKPLYDVAFADKKPFADPAMREWMNQYPDQMAAAIAQVNKSQRLKLDPNEKLVSDISYAADPSRKDWWKWPVAAEDVPEQFKSGDMKNKLQAYIDPSMRNLHNMKRAIWSLAQDHARQGLDDAGDLKSLYHQFANKLYELGPPEYKAATDAYRGDAEMEAAAEVGGNILKMKPGDAKAALDAMAPHERQAAVQGFYGAMKDTDNAKLLRQYVTKPGQYGNQNKVLSMMFTDPVARDDFLSQLDVENGIQAATKFGDQGTLNPGGGGPKEWMSVGIGPHSIIPRIKGAMVDTVLGKSPMRSITNPRAAGLGMDFLTTEATPYARSVGHPAWNDVMDSGPLGMAGHLSNLGSAAAVGAYGGAKLHSFMDDSQPLDAVQP